MRLGWVCAHLPIMDQLVVAKQASDLHSNFLSQRIASRYLEDTDIDAHIRKIRDAYRKQRDCMIATMQDVMPEGVELDRTRRGDVYLGYASSRVLLDGGLYPCAP